MFKASLLYGIFSLYFSLNFLNFFSSSSTPVKQVSSSIDCAPPAMAMNTIQPVKSGLWSDRTVWPGNNVPTTSDDVDIPQNITITLVGTCRAKNLNISGSLKAINGRANNAWIDLRAQSIVVANGGVFEIGTENSPYIANKNANDIRCQITLTGAKNTTLGATYKAIFVQDGGTLELHGKKKKSWTNIAATVNAGATRITLREAVDWEVGDVVALTATGLAQTGNTKRWEQVDQVTISSISNDKKTITTTTPLEYRHIGGSKTYTRSTDGKSWSTDLYGEIGLLSHYIKIQGETSNADGFGGHIMLMKGSISHSENIELFRMGQKGVLGRYPYHWHLNEDKSRGSYLRNSSIHKSFNRAVTIHGTDYVTIDGVYAYDHIGHGIFLEDGAERFNTIKNNVVFVSRRPSNADRLTPSDNQFNAAQNRTPSSYWITNANNTFENNIAAGTEGTGFWIALPHNGTPNQGKPMGESANLAYYKGLNPITQPLRKFDGFVAHTCMNGWDLFDQLKPDHSIDRNWGWRVNANQFIKNGLFYGNDQAVYCGLANGSDPSRVIFQNCAFSDNKRITMLAANIQFQDCLMNADSDLSVFNGTREFHWFYDGAGIYKDCHFEGWDRSNTEMIRPHVGAGATENFNPTFSGITKGFDTPFRFSFIDVRRKDTSIRARKLGNVFKDMDGSLLGKPGTLIRDVAFLRDGHEYRHPSWKNAARSDYYFAGLWMTRATGNIGVVRSKPGTDNVCFFEKPVQPGKGTYKFPMIVNQDFLYTYYFDRVPSDNKRLGLLWYRGDRGDLGLALFKGLGKLGGLNVAGAKRENTKSAVENARVTSYYIEGNGDVLVKFRAEGGNALEVVTVTWNNNGSFKAATLPCNSNVFEAGESIPVSENNPPTINFTSPNQNNFETGADLGVIVTASDDGKVANVKLYLNDVLVRQEGIAPYEWGTASENEEDSSLLNLQAGTHVLRAEATDDQGAINSVTKTITVTAPNQLPLVQFTSPEADEFEEGTGLGVIVTASDDGSVSNVRLYINDVLVRQEGIAPYEWGTASENEEDGSLLSLATGIYVLKAVATDNLGASSEVTKTITVNAIVQENQPPLAEITSPAEGDIFELGEPIDLKVFATDPDGNLDKVNFKINNVFYKADNTRPFENTFTPTEPGTYIIGARAFDKEGLFVEKSVIITIDVALSSTDFLKSDLVDKLKLYPSPTSTVINLVGLSNNDNASVTIIDISGKTVLSTTVNKNDSQIQVSHLASGIYFVKINNRYEQSTISFIKK